MQNGFMVCQCLMIERVDQILSSRDYQAKTDSLWDRLTQDFQSAHTAMPTKFMAREELSFHSHVKILGPLCLAARNLPGDILEIGLWKGKSLALMERLSPPPSKLIGIDPCAIDGQSEELDYFHRKLFPQATIIKQYSETAIGEVLKYSTRFKIIHIDGGHSSTNVLTDFLIYEHFVVPGGFIIFDDYADHEYSPEVKLAVDSLSELRLFDRYDVVGAVQNSYILQRLP